MNSKNSPCNNSYADDQDYERINQLIARYTNIRAAQDDKSSEQAKSKSGKNKDYTSCSRKKKKIPASRNVSGRTTPPFQTYPVNNNNYFYKFPSLGHSKDTKDGEEKSRPIQITCHDLYDSSYDTIDTDTSYSITSLKYSKEDLFTSKSKQVKFQDHFKHVDQQTSFPTVPCEKSCAEKTTYCRPIRNSYHRHFVCKVMERNAKLQLLLTKYVITRQKEKEKDKWNNYVRMIKMKNSCFRDSSKYFSSPAVSRKSEKLLRVNNFHDKSLHQSNSCREMLHDLYDTSDELFTQYPDEYYDRKRYNNSMLNRVYQSQLQCFAHTSRVKRNHKHLGKPERTWSYHRSFYSPRIVIADESTSTKTNKEDQYLKPSPAEWFTAAKVYPRRANVFDRKQSRNAQTNITFGGHDTKVVHLPNEPPELPTSSSNKIEEGDTLMHAVGVINEVKNIVVGNEKHDAVENVSASNEVSEITKPIHNLENKLDQLIDVFNYFIKDMKSKGNANESNDSVVFTTNVDKDQSPVLDTAIEAKTRKRVTIVGDVMTNTSLCALESQLTPSHYLLNMRLNKILYEELDKSNKIRNEIEAMLNPNATRPCTVEISADIPTRERSTEVTDSLSKTKLKESRCEGISVEDISHERSIPTRIPHRSQPDQRIAVNTEPLGLLTFLRLSAEAVRQALSFVPNLGWYLASLHHTVAGDHDYVCHICGAAFARPSELGAHILSHDLGQTRDCSICRHTVDSRRASQLFRCRHCGQRFTRAYCCELHQRSCERRLRNRVSAALLR